MAKRTVKSFTDADFVVKEQPAPEIGASSPIVPTIDGFVFSTKPIPMNLKWYFAPKMAT